jgi:hypothetical protein
MLNTVIDFEVFDKFCKAIPKQIPEGSEDENELWNSFWRFLKSGSNVTLSNYNDQQSIFLTQLTTNRNGTTLKPGKVDHQNFNISQSQNIQTVYFLNEPDAINQVAFRTNNGFFFAFNDDCMDKWKELSFYKNSVLHHRKSANAEKKFTWEKFSDFLLPFTDVIIRDNFLFKDEREIQSKFKNLIECFNEATPVKYNLLIILNKYDLDAVFKRNINELLLYLENKKLINSQRFNLGLVHTAKEHDRFLFFNYLEVDFGKIPDTSTNPTKVTFNPYANPGCYEDAKIILDDLKQIVENSEKNNEAIGYLKNQLLEKI